MRTITKIEKTDRGYEFNVKLHNIGEEFFFECVDLETAETVRTLFIMDRIKEVYSD